MWRGRNQKQLPVFLQHQQPIPRQAQGPGSEPVPAPEDPARLQRHAAQGLAVFLAAVKSEEMATTDHAGRIVIGKGLVRGPDRFQLGALDPELNRSGSIAGREKNQGGRRQRGGGVHRSTAPGSPAKAKQNLSAGRIRRYQSGAGEKQHLAAAAQGGRGGRGIAGLVIGGGPQDSPRSSIEGNQPCLVSSAKVEEHPAVLDQRGAGGAEKALANAEFLVGVQAPDFPAVLQLQTMQHSLGAEGVDLAFPNRRGGSRPAVETEIVPVIGGIVVLPQWAAGLSLKALHLFAVFEAMEQNQAAGLHHGSTEPFSQRLPPEDGRPRGGPGIGNRRSPVDAVPLRAQELGPVRRSGRPRTDRMLSCTQ